MPAGRPTANQSPAFTLLHRRLKAYGLTGYLPPNPTLQNLEDLWEAWDRVWGLKL